MRLLLRSLSRGRFCDHCDFRGMICRLPNVLSLFCPESTYLPFHLLCIFTIHNSDTLQATRQQSQESQVNPVDLYHIEVFTRPTWLAPGLLSCSLLESSSSFKSCNKETNKCHSNQSVINSSQSQPTKGEGGLGELTLVK